MFVSRNGELSLLKKKKITHFSVVENYYILWFSVIITPTTAFTRYVICQLITHVESYEITQLSKINMVH